MATPDDLPISTEPLYSILKKSSVLIVDDDPSFSELLDEMLCGEVERLCIADSGKTALALAAQHKFDIAVVDFFLGKENGLELIGRIKNVQPDIFFVLITGNPQEHILYSLQKMRSVIVLAKPFSVVQLKFSICRGLALGEHHTCPVSAFEDFRFREYQLIGKSDYIKDLRHKVLKYAGSDVPVLICGPTGTGKEIIASAIHENSMRSEKSMITVNSSAIPEHLEESEFFGHGKGAFTGAGERKDGIIKCADGSTLFLDEVAELSARMQVKLLRVLDGHEFTRVGETAPQKSDFRLINATNRPLKNMIDAGTFREDLYFRIKSGFIATQPLANHAEDIPCLIDHFLNNIQKKHSRDYTITDDATELLISYEWPGNVRELKNAIQSLCATASTSGVIDRQNAIWGISTSRNEKKTSIVPFTKAKKDFEKGYYQGLLHSFDGNISLAAKAAGIERAYFSKRVKALGINATEYHVKGGDEE